MNPLATLADTSSLDNTTPLGFIAVLQVVVGTGQTFDECSTEARSCSGDDLHGVAFYRATAAAGNYAAEHGGDSDLERFDFGAPVVSLLP